MKKFIATLKDRFEDNVHRHPEMKWSDVLARLEQKPKKLESLSRMEKTGGEPDVIGVDPVTGEFLFVDCSAESPEGRRSLCFDKRALEYRKNNKPVGSVEELTAEMGVELLNEQVYRDLQKLGKFDQKTSSWIQTPPAIRSLGGALFCDRRYETVFVYHNGAGSYYAARGFRALLRV